MQAFQQRWEYGNILSRTLWSQLVPWSIWEALYHIPWVCLTPAHKDTPIYPCRPGFSIKHMGYPFVLVSHCLCPLSNGKKIIALYGCVHAKSLQSCLTLCDPMNCSLPSSPVHVILWARILEWVAMPSSSVSSWPSDRTRISCIAGNSWPLSHQGSYHCSVEVGKLWPVGKTQFAYFCK